MEIMLLEMKNNFVQVKVEESKFHANYFTRFVSGLKFFMFQTYLYKNIQNISLLKQQTLKNNRNSFCFYQSINRIILCIVIRLFLYKCLLSYSFCQDNSKFNEAYQQPSEFNSCENVSFFVTSNKLQ